MPIAKQISIARGIPPEVALHPTRHKSVKINAAYHIDLTVYEVQEHQGHKDHNCAFGHEAHKTSKSLFLDVRIHCAVFVFLFNHSDNSILCFALLSLQRGICHARRPAQRQKSARQPTLIHDPAIGTILVPAAGHLAGMPKIIAMGESLDQTKPIFSIPDLAFKDGHHDLSRGFWGFQIGP